MRKYLLAAAAAAAIATPAAARDGSGYIGVDAGLLLSTHSNIHIDATNSYYCSGGEGGTYFGSYFTNCQATFNTHYKTGFDGDVVGGYDFGMFRLEGELGYKYAGHDRYSVAGVNIHSDGHSSAWSAMVNGLIDFGPSNGINFSLGGGAGYAHVRYNLNIDDPSFDTVDGLDTTDSQGRFAWQLLAEARVPISSQLDVGLKYRYFDAGTIRGVFDDDNGGTFRESMHINSHSLLASLIYNFTPPPPPPAPPVVEAPPPPPPPPPATQTCPDGSVILATDTCPAPPPPPPPPPAQRGDRGE